MQPADLDRRFTYHPPPDALVRQKHEKARALCRTLAFEINDLIDDGREKSLAITSLEETLFWVNAAIARDGSDYAAS